MDKEIYAYKCKQCGELHYPFRMVCKQCGKNKHFEFETVVLPKKGTLVTYTELYSLPGDFNVSTLGLGMVKLENGVMITGQLNIPAPKTGMKVVGKVESVRKSDYNESSGIVFYPDK